MCSVYYTPAPEAPFSSAYIPSRLSPLISYSNFNLSDDAMHCLGILGMHDENFTCFKETFDGYICIQ